MCVHPFFDVQGRIDKRTFVTWWEQTMKPPIAELLAAAANTEDDKGMKTALNAVLSPQELTPQPPPKPPLLQHHPALKQLQAALFKKTGSESIIINEARDNDEFKNKLGAIFGGRSPQPSSKGNSGSPRPGGLVTPSADMEAKKAKMANLFGNAPSPAGGASTPSKVYACLKKKNREGSICRIFYRSSHRKKTALAPFFLLDSLDTEMSPFLTLLPISKDLHPSRITSSACSSFALFLLAGNSHVG
jgi:hypothetical protein